MTSQVVLMNKLGIAIASDSAVTSMRGKVLVGSEKIFDLQDPHKVAILTSGVSTFMEYPWEVLFSAWSETLDKSLPNISDYSESLNKFLRTVLATGKNISLQEINYIGHQLSEVTDQFFKVYYDFVFPMYEANLSPDIFEKFKEGTWTEDFRLEMNSLVTEEMIQQVSEAIKSHIQERRDNCPPALNISESQSLVWVEEYWRTVESNFDKYYCSSWPELEGIEDLANLWLATFLLYPDYEDASEVCIVGYGDDDLLPSVSFFKIFGSLGGTLIKTAEDTWKPSPYAQRLFFGQSDAIMSLFSGDDYLLTSTAENAQRMVLGSLVEQLEAKSDEAALFVKEYVENSIATNSIGDELRKVGRKQRSEPFYRAIGMAPISDLAEFASQLVGVQAAYASMNQDNPTVGGFIDVAVITHRGGFQWIRHKK